MLTECVELSSEKIFFRYSEGGEYETFSVK